MVVPTLTEFRPSNGFHPEMKTNFYNFELFNIKNNIGETHNLIESHPEKVKELSEILTSYLKEVNAQMPTHKLSGEKVAYPHF